MQNGKLNQPNQEFTRNVNCQLKMEWSSPSADQDLFIDFSTNEVMTAIIYPSVKIMPYYNKIIYAFNSSVPIKSTGSVSLCYKTPPTSTHANFVVIMKICDKNLFSNNVE